MIGIILAIGGAAPSEAAFLPVDNFEIEFGHAVGNNIHGINGWTVSQGNGTILADPAGGANQVLSAHQTSEAVHIFKGLTLPNSNTGTLYYQFRAAEPTDSESATDISVGMADVAAPALSGTGSGFAAYEPQIAHVNVQTGTVIPGELRIRDAAANATVGFTHSTWYDVWMVIDNTADLYQIYLRGGAYASQTEVNVGGQNWFTFRNTLGDGLNSNTMPQPNDLLSLLIRAGGSHRGPIYLDDIHFDAEGVNLTLPGAAVALALEVNKTTGLVRIVNSTESPLDLQGYEVLSAAGSLSAGAAWTVPPGWDKSPSSSATGLLAGALLEANSVLLQPGQWLSLGQAYNPAATAEDLEFRVRLAGGGIVDGATVSYITSAGVPGDYNLDGVVDAADYTVWRDLLGTAAQLPNEGAGVTPGEVTQEDYEVWKANFGLSAGSGAALQPSAAVPEPQSLALLLIAAAGLASRRATRQAA